MDPKTGTKRKAVKFEEESSTQPAKKQRRSEGSDHEVELRISPVDRFNVRETEEPVKHPVKHFVIWGYVKGANGNRWRMTKVMERYQKVDYRGPCQNRIIGLPVSPKTIATFEQMNAAEREAHERWEDEKFEADPNKLDPDTLSAFYPGMLKLYGKRQVPWD